MKSSLELLNHAELRITNGRIAILDFFKKNAKVGLSIHDLLHLFSKEYDKVTLYRTINTFEEKGLIHKIIDESGLDKYALCGENCSDEQHNHDHVHFYCLSCGKTECLDENLEITIKLPAHYLKKHSNFVISGICAFCR